MSENGRAALPQTAPASKSKRHGGGTFVWRRCFVVWYLGRGVWLPLFVGLQGISAALRNTWIEHET